MVKEKRNLCESCKRVDCCIEKFVFEKEDCNEYDPLTMDELLERDKVIASLIVGICPECGNENARDCEHNPLVDDITVGWCFDCNAYWCLECGYIFDMRQKKVCPHWEICGKCSEENGYLNVGELVERICPTCENYKEGCQLEDPANCEEYLKFMCPYESDISNCAKIRNLK